MKFADWVPIIVAAITFASVLAGSALSGGRAKQQLEALKVVQEALAGSQDKVARGLLAEAERHLSGRIEVRYRPLSRRVVRSILSLLLTALLFGGVMLAIQLIAPSKGATLGAVVAGAFAGIITITAALITRVTLERRNEAASEAHLAELRRRIRALVDDQADD